MLYSANGNRIQNRELFNTYLAKAESYGGNVANGDGWENVELMVITTGEMPNVWGELPKESKRIGLPVMVIDSYSDEQSAYQAMMKLDALVN